MVQPLVPGEHVDTDGGSRISRSDVNPHLFTIRHDGNSMELSRSEIKNLAELADFTVIDDV